MELQLPKQQRRAFEELARLSPEEKKRFIASVESQALSLNVSDLSAKLGKDAGVSQNVAGNVLLLLHSMYTARVLNGFSAREFADAICRAASRLSQDSMPLTSEQLKEAADFIAEALSLDKTLGAGAKALSILRDQERLFNECRVLTDCRPVFSENLEEPPPAAVILHNLRITYAVEGERKDFFVSLDAEDLESLRAAIERAQKKETTLRSSLANSIPCLS